MPTLSGVLRLLRSLLLEDWWLKITCLGLAALMWFYIDAELTDQSDFQASLRLADIEIPSGWDISGEAPMPKFAVRLRGPRRRLQLFNADSIAFRKQQIGNPQAGRNAISIGTGDVEAEGLEVLSVTPKDEKGAAVSLVSTQITRRMTLDVRPLALSGTAMTVEPNSVEVEVQAEEQEFAAPDFAASNFLFVEWPRAWEIPKDATTVLGPLTVQTRTAPQPRVQIRGVNGGAMPMVNVRGVLAPLLGK